MRFSLGRWIGMVTGAESLGFLIPVLGLAITTVLGLGAWSAWIMVALFGAGEGALLGLGQAEALHGTAMAVPVRRWAVATAAAAAVAWSLGMLPSTLMDAGIDVDLHNPLTWLGMTIGGLVLLLSIPTAQYLVLRGRVDRAALWIPVNLVAWSVGLMFTFLPGPFIDESTPGAVLASAFAVAGVGMAATVATITGLFWRNRAAASSSPNNAQESGTCSSLGA